jgi:hypothetical protein
MEEPVWFRFFNPRIERIFTNRERLRRRILSLVLSLVLFVFIRKFVVQNSTDDTFLTKVGVFKIEQNGQIAHHLSNMGIIDLGDDLGIYQNKMLNTSKPSLAEKAYENVESEKTDWMAIRRNYLGSLLFLKNW